MLLILISLLNHKSWDLRQLGLSGRKAKVFFHEWKMFLQNSGNKLRETLKSRLEWKIKHSPNVFLIKVKGIIFHSWKLSSYSFLIQEHYKLIIFDLMSAFFNPPCWKSLQMVSCFTFGEDKFHKKSFCICCNASIIWFGITKTWAKKVIFDKTNV